MTPWREWQGSGGNHMTGLQMGQDLGLGRMTNG